MPGDDKMSVAPVANQQQVVEVQNSQSHLALGPMPGSVHSASAASAYGTSRSARSQVAPPPGFDRSSATLPVTNLALRGTGRDRVKTRRFRL